MNTTLKPILLGLTAIAAGVVTPSCVDAGYAYGDPRPAYRSGYVVQTLPHGYREEYIGGSRYYYHNNVYYRRQGTTYIVVDSPRRTYSKPVPDRRDWDRRHDDHRDRDGRRDWDDRRDDRRGPPGPPKPGGPGWDGKKHWD